MKIAVTMRDNNYNLLGTNKWIIDSKNKVTSDGSADDGKRRMRKKRRKKKRE